MSERGTMRTSLTDWAAAALALPDVSLWRLDEDGYQPALEHDVETRLAVSNGLLGVRGSLEQPTVASRPRTFIAGLFVTPPGEPPIPMLVQGPDWLRFAVVIDDEPLTLDGGETLTHRRALDFRQGALIRTWRQRTRAGAILRLRTLRFTSLANRALAVQLVQLAVEQRTPISLEAWLEPVTDLWEVRYRAPMVQIWRPGDGPKHVAVASSMTLWHGDQPLRQTRGSDGRAVWRWDAEPGQVATFARVVAFAHGAQEDDGAHAHAILGRARRAGLPRLLAAHTRAWAARWQTSDVVVAGDDVAQCALRFAIYHLISAANPDDPHTSIGARALTGDAYRGHVFWDTEIFLLPFYTATWPAAARALLLYRYHTLPAARAKAARLGYRGALYAWESADTGEEATPPYVRGPDGQVIVIRCGTEEQHISADIAYAVWQYWRVTADESFLRDAGAEIMLETARFWASRATLEGDARYHIRCVIGPDEYHEEVDDNAYTNGLAQWNIERGLEVVQLLQTRWPDHWAALRDQIGISMAELDTWHDVVTRLVTGVDPTNAVIEQFAGFFDLEPIDLAAYTPRTAPMDVLLGRERTQRSQVIKQADVVMLLALLWERSSAAVHAANFRYYEPRCGHGSSLSPAIHALVAARLGEAELALGYFHQAAAIDLNDTMGNAAGGVHIATLGGLWQAAVFGFGGLSFTTRGLRCDPHLPDRWWTLGFPIQWRGRRVHITIRREPLTCTAALEHGPPLVVEVGELAHTLVVAHPWVCSWNSSAGRWEEGA